MYQLSLLFLKFYHKAIFVPKRLHFLFGGKIHVDNEYTNFKAHDFTIFLQTEFDGSHTGEKGHIQQYLLNSYAIRVMILTQRLCAGRLPAKRGQAVKRQIEIKNYPNSYQVNLEDQSIHNKNF